MIEYAVLRVAAQGSAVFGNKFEKNWLRSAGGSTMMGARGERRLGPARSSQRKDAHVVQESARCL